MKGDPLKPAALLATRLEPGGLELAGDIPRRDLVSARAGIAAFEQVVGKEFDVGAEPLRRKYRRRRLAWRRTETSSRESKRFFLFMRA